MVKCADCGFLALRNLTNREFEETEEFYREYGMPVPVRPEQATNGKYIYEVYPYCFIRSYDINSLSFEFHHKQNYSPEKAICKVLNDERECSSFTKWQQGFTPKEHREMIDRKFVMEMEERRRKNDRKWHWIELAVIILMTGLFTLLGAWIAGIH